MTAPNHNHPDRYDLEAFGVGLLDPARSAEVEKHVAGCESCCAAVQKAPDDTLVYQLREAAAPAEPSPPGELERHPRYRVLKLLGRGGMGAVYQAEHGVMRRLVALKVINREFTANPAAVERFQREIQAAALLHHPNIVVAYDAEQAGDTHFLVMEYIDGVGLARLVAERGPLPVAEACEYVRQAALGLQHAHERGMVHRDVKPHNLIRAAHGVVKVLDFGLASVGVQGEGQLTASNMVMGTADYIAPEQAEDAHAADARSDIYALGCTLYHLLTGRPPFTHASTLLKLVAHREEEPAPVRAVRPDVPEELAAILSRMMAKSPADRYQTAADVAAALAAFADTAALPRPRTKSRRRLWIAAAAAAVCMAGLAAAVVAVVVRIQTEQGEVTIQTDDPNIEVVVTKGGKLVRIVDPQSKQTWQLDPAKFELSMADQPDGLTITLHGKQPITLTRKGEKLVVITRGQPAATERVGDKVWLEGCKGVVWAVAFSPDGRYTLTSEPNLLRDRTDNRAVHCLGHGGWFAAFSPDGRQALTSDSSSRPVILWNVETGEQVRRYGAPTGRVRNAAFSPDGKRVAASEWDTVPVWDAATGAELMRVPTQQDCSPAFAFTPDNRRLLVIHSDIKSIRTYEVETGKEVEPRLTSPDPVHGLALSPDGKTVLAVRSDADEILVWDAASGKLRRRLTGGQKLRIGQSVAFLPDGRRALAFNDAGTMTLWDVPEGREIQRWEDQGNIVSLAISPDGRWALCGCVKKAFLFRLPDAPTDKPGDAP